MRAKGSGLGQTNFLSGNTCKRLPFKDGLISLSCACYSCSAEQYNLMPDASWRPAAIQQGLILSRRNTITMRPIMIMGTVCCHYSFIKKNFNMSYSSSLNEKSLFHLYIWFDIILLIFHITPKEYACNIIYLPAGRENRRSNLRFSSSMKN